MSWYSVSHFDTYGKLIIPQQWCNCLYIHCHVLLLTCDVFSVSFVCPIDLYLWRLHAYGETWVTGILLLILPFFRSVVDLRLKGEWEIRMHDHPRRTSCFWRVQVKLWVPWGEFCFCDTRKLWCDACQDSGKVRMDAIPPRVLWRTRAQSVGAALLLREGHMLPRDSWTSSDGYLYINGRALRHGISAVGWRGYSLERIVQCARVPKIPKTFWRVPFRGGGICAVCGTRPQFDKLSALPQVMRTAKTGSFLPLPFTVTDLSFVGGL